MNKIIIVVAHFVAVVLVGWICGLLGSWAGADGTDKNWRRILIPAILAVLAIVYAGWWAVTVGLIGFVFAIGYGIPDENDPEGSTLGGFVYRHIANQDMFASNLITRGIIGLLAGVSLLSIPLLTGSWIFYTAECLLIIATYVMFGAIVHNEGTFEFKGKELLWEEYMIYFWVGFISASLIFFS